MMELATTSQECKIGQNEKKLVYSFLFPQSFSPFFCSIASLGIFRTFLCLQQMERWSIWQKYKTQPSFMFIRGRENQTKNRQKDGI
jgi:hypothetical protein